MSVSYTSFGTARHNFRVADEPPIWLVDAFAATLQATGAELTWLKRRVTVVIIPNRHLTKVAQAGNRRFLGVTTGKTRI